MSSRRRNSTTVRLSEVVAAISNVPGFHQRLSESKLWNQWPEVVGEYLGSKTKPRRLDQKTLTIDVENGALATQLHFMQRDLLARIHKQVPQCDVRALRFQVVADLGLSAESSSAPSPKSKIKLDSRLPKPLTDALKDLPDSELREQIRRLMILTRSRAS